MSSSFDYQRLSPRANIFLLLNLGCEMLYVIDQRLKAQQIAEDKSRQVIHDITAVLLDSKFVDSIIVGSTHSNAQLLTVEHCKFMLKDIATCSLMRLDDVSMEKLWNLMTVIYKWQLYVSKHQHHLLDITFRHLNSISKLYPESKRSMLIDFVKNILLDFWNVSSDQEQLDIYRTNISWLECFNIKISVLIRLGFQTLDGDFLNNNDCSHFQDFVDNIGENIFVKSNSIFAKNDIELKNETQNNARFDVNRLAEIFCKSQSNDTFQDLKPINGGTFQGQFEKSLRQCNIPFNNLEVDKCDSVTATTNRSNGNGLIFDLQLFPNSTPTIDVDEFIHMKATYNRNGDIPGSSNSGMNTSSTGLTKDLLDFYSNIK